jgi:Protein of unknown function (DUF2934)
MQILPGYQWRPIMKQRHAATHPAKASVPKAPAQSTDHPTPAAGSDAKDEFVRQAAYYYYEARGRIGGNELDDWLRAEAEFERMRAEGEAAAPGGNATH